MADETQSHHVMRRPSKEEVLERALGEGNRVRVLIGSRKMKLPGVLARQGDGSFKVQTNWGREYVIPTDERLHELEVGDDRGRYETVDTED